MKLNQLSPAKGARKAKQRVGRGIGSGWGKTAGYGSKGQSARSGAKGNGFEGGQMPLIQKMPKRGFHNPFKKVYEVVNLEALSRFETGATVDPAALHALGMVRKNACVKILGVGDAPKNLVVKAHKFSKSAAEKLTAAGGKTEVLG
jgi:large subunit ribosomal protein L15